MNFLFQWQCMLGEGYNAKKVYRQVLPSDTGWNERRVFSYSLGFAFNSWFYKIIVSPCVPLRYLNRLTSFFNNFSSHDKYLLSKLLIVRWFDTLGIHIRWQGKRTSNKSTNSLFYFFFKFIIYFIYINMSYGENYHTVTNNNSWK